MIKMKIKASEAKRYGDLIWNTIYEDREAEKQKQIYRLASNRRFFGFRKPMTAEEATARVNFSYHWSDEPVQWKRLNSTDGYHADELLSASIASTDPDDLIEIDGDIIRCIAVYDIEAKQKKSEVKA